MRSLGFVTLAMVLAVPLGCNSSSDGDEGLISFTPHTCGRVGCDFTSGIAVGGRVSLHIAGDDGVSTAGLEVVSSDPTTMTVTEVPDVGGRATWQLDGLAVGTLELQVIDPDAGDDEIDRLEVEIFPVARLGLENFIGSAVGPSTGGGADETWTVNADSPVSFRVTPFRDDDQALMGLFDYAVTLDPELSDGLIDSDLSEGRLYFRVVAGTWAASWDDGQSTFSASIVAE